MIDIGIYSMTNYWPGVSGKENIINPRWRPNKKRNGHLSPRSETNIYHLPASCPPPFVSYRSLHLSAVCRAHVDKNISLYIYVLFRSCEFEVILLYVSIISVRNGKLTVRSKSEAVSSFRPLISSTRPVSIPIKNIFVSTA
jgi:hypothetical protein